MHCYIYELMRKFYVNSTPFYKRLLSNLTFLNLFRVHHRVHPLCLKLLTPSSGMGSMIPNLYKFRIKMRHQLSRIFAPFLCSQSDRVKLAPPYVPKSHKMIQYQFSHHIFGKWFPKIKFKGICYHQQSILLPLSLI